MELNEWIEEERRARAMPWRERLARLGRQLHAAALAVLTWMVDALDSALARFDAKETLEQGRRLAIRLERAIATDSWMEARVLMKEIHEATTALPRGALSRPAPTEMGSYLRSHAISACAHVTRAGWIREHVESARLLELALADLESIQCLLTPAWELGLMHQRDSWELWGRTNDLIRRLEKERVALLAPPLPPLPPPTSPAPRLLQQDPHPGAA